MSKRFDKKPLQKINTQYLNDQLITVGDTEFITDGTYLWNIKKINFLFILAFP